MATEIKLTLTGYRADEVLPGESRNYLCCTDLLGLGNAYWLYLPYSAEHKKFNAQDGENGDEHAMAMDYWFDLPGTIAEIEKGDADHD